MRSIIRRSLAAAVLVGLASLVQAADPAKPPFKCLPEGNQQQINVCADQDFVAADKRLNVSYEDLLETLPASRQKQLRTAQDEWLKRRDPICESRAEPFRGGPMQPMVYQRCRTELSGERLDVLEALAK